MFFLLYSVVLEERRVLSLCFTNFLQLSFSDYYASETCQLRFYRERHSGSEVLHVVQTVRRTA